jgi:alpha-1,6-mannosyltransferase
MNGALVLRFSILLAAEILFFGSLNLFDDWTLQLMPVRFVGAAFASGIAFLAATSHFPPKIDIRRQAILFWGAAILLRIIALPLVPSDDLIRYQWEGKIQRAGFNPYLMAVSDPELDDLRRDFPEAAKINHPELRAFDAPGAELLFKFLSGVTDRPLFYKIIFAIADLAVAAVLLRLIGGDQPYRDAAWYAWNPLIVYSFAGAAHFDSVMILSLVAGIFALVRSTSEIESSMRQWLWACAAAAIFGIGISLNIVAASLLLLWVFALRWRAVVLALTAIIPVLFALPFGFPKVRIWDSLSQLTHLSRLNDLFWWWIEDTFWPNPHQRSFHYVPIMIVCVVVVSFFFVRNWKRGMLWTLGTVLALSPILHPWYCTWILPLATWRRAYGWHVLSITLFAYYLFWDERLFALPWHADPWMRALIIAPVLAALIMLAAQKRIAAPAS